MKYLYDIKINILIGVLHISAGLGRSVIFSLLFLSFFLALPVSAAEKTVGVLMSGDIPYYQDIHKAFTSALATEGLGPGKVEILLQKPSPDPMSWTNAVRKFVSVGVDAIVVYGAPAAIVASEETSEIPIVFAGVYDPDNIGLKGKNHTGISSKIPLSSLLKNLRSISEFSSLGVVISKNEKDTVLQAEEAAKIGKSMGFSTTVFDISAKGDADKIGNVGALFLTNACNAVQCVTKIVDTIRKMKIPSGSSMGGAENMGIILTLAANPQEQGATAAKTLNKVISGAKAASIPVEVPKKIDLTINFKEAKDLDLKIPFDLLSLATRVIK